MQELFSNTKLNIVDLPPNNTGVSVEIRKRRKPNHARFAYYVRVKSTLLNFRIFSIIAVNVVIK